MFSECTKLERVVLNYEAADLYEVSKQNLLDSFISFPIKIKLIKKN